MIPWKQHQTQRMGIQMCQSVSKHITLYFLHPVLQIQYHQDDAIMKNSKLTRLNK